MSLASEERVHRETEAILAVQIAYRREQKAFSESRLNHDIVAEIAWRLIKANVQPTVQAVTTVHGSGSPNTIHAGLKAFYDGTLFERMQTPPPALHVPASIQAMWKEAVAVANESVAAEAEAGRLANEARTKDLDARAAEIAEEKARADFQTKEMAKALRLTHGRAVAALKGQRDAKRQIRSAEKRLAASESRADTQEKRFAALEAEIAGVKLEKVASDAALATEQARARDIDAALANTTHQAESDAKDRRHELDLAAERLNVAQDQLTAAKRSAEAQAARLETVELELAKSREALSEARASEARLMSLLEFAQEKIAVAAKDATQLADRNATQGTTITALEKQVSGLEATAEELRVQLAERQTRLDATIERERQFTDGPK